MLSIALPSKLEHREAQDPALTMQIKRLKEMMEQQGKGPRSLHDHMELNHPTNMNHLLLTLS